MVIRSSKSPLQGRCWPSGSETTVRQETHCRSRRALERRCRIPGEVRRCPLQVRGLSQKPCANQPVCLSSEKGRRGQPPPSRRGRAASGPYTGGPYTGGVDPLCGPRGARAAPHRRQGPSGAPGTLGTPGMPGMPGMPQGPRQAHKGTEAQGTPLPPCKASPFLRLASQFLRRLARHPFAHPHPPLFECDFASLEMQYLRSPRMHTTRIGAATMTFLKDGARTVTFLAHLL